MAETRIAPLTLEGWYVLHQFFRVAWPGLERMEPSDRDEAARELDGWLGEHADLGADGWTGAYRIVGGGVDVMLTHFRSSLEALAEVEDAVVASSLGDALFLELDYTSVVELGLYRTTSSVVGELREEGVDPSSAEGRERLREAAKEERQKAYVQDRLYPRQPDEMPYVCFYPMDKRRAPGENWYTLPLEERNEMMVEHGQIGRLYAGRVSQIISGSIGFDDWEWAVTLFAGEPLNFKKLVSEMRFDEVSARYAEFGPFYVGRRMQPDGFLSWLGGPR